MKKNLKLSEETVNHLDQIYLMWLNHSETEEETESLNALYEELSLLIEAGNPYREYEISEYKNTHLIHMCGDTLGIAFFTE